MKIVIDLRIFGPKPGGLGRYNQKFLEELIKLDKNNRYILLFRQDPKLELPDNFEIKIFDCQWYSLKEQIVLPFVLKKIKPDLVHFPHFNVPKFFNGKFIVTIHDLIMTKFPSRKASTLNGLFFGIKYWMYNIVIRHAIKKSKKIIAVSKFTAKDIVKHFVLSKTEEQKINVIHEGLTVPAATMEKKIYLPSKFFLYVGNAYPHKNLEFLVEVFKDFLKTHPDFYLVLVGQRNYFYERLKKHTVQLFGENLDRVVFTDFIEDVELGTYYNKATAYVFPSLYEGFGLPPLEAMAYELPIISSNTSSLPEILGDAALYFNPENKDDLLDKMKEIITNTELRKNLKIKGHQQIKKYSWSKMAKEIIEVYNKSN
ncbi:glycosyltransferase family 4 protein [bacterium]|nr:glycosyltransferase family 4 protein [bacterium]